MIFSKLGITPPPIYYKLAQNKMIAFFAVMILGGNIQGMVSSSGAFEIMFNDRLIFSKLQAGRMPTVPEIEDILAAYLKH